ncbi:MAG: PhnD/SsuA/transferrin family substrate-binding protein [Hyphomicrobiaceae bacterium]|nr:PhnD/SsuA/transferrin family substrate-binding protein [Hyphomicrobiaceae bacterium]
MFADGADGGDFRMDPCRPFSRRRLLLAGLGGAGLAAAPELVLRAAERDVLLFGLTPVFLTSDLALLDGLRRYLEQKTGRSVQLVLRRTYQEITSLLVSRQLDAAWICGYPFVAFRNDLSLLAVPVWRGDTRYQSYLIAHDDVPAENLAGLRGTVHAFSDPDSNSGYLVTRAALLSLSATPAAFFRHTFFTYGHRNVIRAVSVGMAGSGSVDGYVFEVLREAEPDLLRSVRVVQGSEWLGFPPVACPAAAAASQVTQDLRLALLGMADSELGRQVLSLLRLDGFKLESPELFDGIADQVRFVQAAAQ